MKKIFKILLVVVILAGVLVGAVYAYNALKDDVKLNSKEESTAEQIQNKTEQQPGESAEVTENDRTLAPDFAVEDKDGNTVRLSDMRGKPTIVNFWTSWCPPCKAELPDFDAAYKELGNEFNFMIVHLSQNWNDKQSDGQRYIKSEGFSFPVYYDVNGQGDAAFDKGGIPLSVFIDKDGKVVNTFNGMLSADDLRQMIDQLR